MEHLFSDKVKPTRAKIYVFNRALDVGTTSKRSVEQRNDLISTKFRCCPNVMCPLGSVYQTSR